MPGFLDIPAALASERTALAHIIPVPYDATSTYRKGADRGPDAIIKASAQVEWYDIETESEPCRCGIYTQSPILCTSPDPVDLAPLVRGRVAEVLVRRGLPIVLGGEHSVSIGAFEAGAEAFEDLSILQIDAHGDTRETYHNSTHNHACVMARARELAPIVQIGIRAIDKMELLGMDADRVFFAHEIACATDRAWIEQAVERLTEHVYLTIDLDGFDPSVIPSTGTPEPGGLDWYTVNALVRAVARTRTIIGFDVVELCPDPAHHASDFTAARLVYRVLAEILAG